MMQFKNKVRILGAKPVDFKSDDGRVYDHVALYCQVPLDSTNGSWGTAVEVFNWQDRQNIVLLRQHQPGVEADVTFEMVTTGKSIKYVVKDVQLPPVSHKG